MDNTKHALSRTDAVQLTNASTCRTSCVTCVTHVTCVMHMWQHKWPSAHIPGNMGTWCSSWFWGSLRASPSTISAPHPVLHAGPLPRAACCAARLPARHLVLPHAPHSPLQVPVPSRALHPPQEPGPQRIHGIQLPRGGGAHRLCKRGTLIVFAHEVRSSSLHRRYAPCVCVCMCFVVGACMCVRVFVFVRTCMCLLLFCYLNERSS